MSLKQQELYLAYLEYETLEKPYLDKFNEKVDTVFKKYGTPYFSPAGIRGIHITDKIQDEFILPLSRKFSNDTKIIYEWWQKQELKILAKWSRTDIHH